MKVEFRIPISANKKYLRMLRFLIESIYKFGGELVQSADFVVSISRDTPRRDLIYEYPWLSRYPIKLRWVSQVDFIEMGYNGTGLDRFLIESQADVVIVCDVDLLIVDDLTEIIIQTHTQQKLLGFIAHVSPFPKKSEAESNYIYWRKVFSEAGLSTPDFNHVHTGWGIMGITDDESYKYCPYYYNFGFVISPRLFIDKMGSSYKEEILFVDKVYETWFKSQIANTLAISRHNIPCGLLSMNYNFPLHVDETKIRKINIDKNDENSPEDIKVFHYLGNGVFNKGDFSDKNTLKKALERRELDFSAKLFKQKLNEVHNIIEKKRF